MCGEHSAVSLPNPTSQGSSPHVRGALDAPYASESFGGGIIPACAGSTVEEF